MPTARLPLRGRTGRVVSSPASRLPLRRARGRRVRGRPRPVLSPESRTGRDRASVPPGVNPCARERAVQQSAVRCGTEVTIPVRCARCATGTTRLRPAERLLRSAAASVPVEHWSVVRRACNAACPGSNAPVRPHIGNWYPGRAHPCGYPERGLGADGGALLSAWVESAGAVHGRTVVHVRGKWGESMPRWKALPDELDPQVREFASQLRLLVDRSGLSVAAVADRTGYSKTSWERYLNGRLLAPKGAIVALAEVTGTNPVHLATMWELAERAWSRSEMRHDMTMEAIRISQARAALGEFGPSSAKGGGGPQPSARGRGSATASPASPASPGSAVPVDEPPSGAPSAPSQPSGRDGRQGAAGGASGGRSSSGSGAGGAGRAGGGWGAVASGADGGGQFGPVTPVGPARAAGPGGRRRRTRGPSARGRGRAPRGANGG